MIDNNLSGNPKRASVRLLGLIPFFRPYLRNVVFAVLALLITAIMILFFGTAIKYLIDYSFVEKNHNFLNKMLLIFLGAVILLAISGFYRSSLINNVAEKVVADLRKRVYDHIIRVSVEFFEIAKAGDVISRLTVDSVILYNMISTTISFFLRNIILFFGGVVFLFLTSVKLSIISVLLIPIVIAPIIVLGRSVKLLSEKSQQSLSRLGSHIEETVIGVKTIQSYLCEDKEVRNFNAFVDNVLKISIHKNKVKALMITFVIILAFGAVGIVLWIGGLDVLSGRITSGELSSFIFYSIICAISLVSISQIAGQVQTASSAAGRIFELLLIKSPVQEAENPIPFENQEELTIKFDKVIFSYPSRKERLIINDFNLTVAPKEKLAIVGSSGCGKSTILQLLLRFYEVNSGSILLNDHNIKQISFADLRKNFSYISQDCFIFSGTIFENIAYADKSITKDDVEEIIKKTPALSFINKFPDQLDTFVGEKGIKLSAGERQRISIARAILKDSPILLLDEATSALDNENEFFINDAIDSLAQRKTVITIAHKLSTVIHSDRIIYLKDGQIAEIGSHNQLIKKKGLYYKMYQVELLS